MSDWKIRKYYLTGATDNANYNKILTLRKKKKKKNSSDRRSVVCVFTTGNELLTKNH